MEYFMKFGCYLNMDCIVVESDKSMEKLEVEAYERAYEETAGWVGLHGFCMDLEDYPEDERDEVEEEEIENALEYYV